MNWNTRCCPYVAAAAATSGRLRSPPSGGGPAASHPGMFIKYGGTAPRPPVREGEALSALSQCGKGGAGGEAPCRGSKGCPLGAKTPLGRVGGKKSAHVCRGGSAPDTAICVRRAKNKGRLYGDGPRFCVLAAMRPTAARRRGTGRPGRGGSRHRPTSAPPSSGGGSRAGACSPW